MKNKVTIVSIYILSLAIIWQIAAYYGNYISIERDSNFGKIHFTFKSQYKYGRIVGNIRGIKEGYNQFLMDWDEIDIKLLTRLPTSNGIIPEEQPIPSMSNEDSFDWYRLGEARGFNACREQIMVGYCIFLQKLAESPEFDIKQKEWIKKILNPNI